MTMPDFKEFERLAEMHRIVPVYTTMVADKETPITIYEKLADEAPVFLLESGQGREKLSRYSFIGLDPFMTFTSYGDQVKVSKKIHQAGEEKWRETKNTENPLTSLKKLYREYTAPEIPELTRYYSGGTGYFGYETVGFIETNREVVGKEAKDKLKLPDIYLVFPRIVVIYDHLFHKYTLVMNIDVMEESSRKKGGGNFVHSPTDEGKTSSDSNDHNFKSKSDLKQKYHFARQKLAQLTETINRENSFNEKPASMFFSGETKEATDKSGTENSTMEDLIVHSEFKREDFKQAVSQAKQYIENGDIFQVVLSRCLEIKLEDSGWNIYRVLRTVNPSPYMYYLNFHDFEIVGASPEMLVRKEGSEVCTRPIAGTRPRGQNEKEDRALAHELYHDPKEKAEHLMLLDLGRNDIGRISQYGSVEVVEEFGIEYFSHVMHMTSEVKGTVEGDKDLIDVLKACFPAGTVSGAPKIRAMEIISEYEPVKRGPYSGGVGYLSFNGNMDIAITIRTLLVKDDTGYLQAGAGIVADSIPDNEFKETLSKARGFLKVIKEAQKHKKQISTSKGGGSR